MYTSDEVQRCLEIVRDVTLGNTLEERLEAITGLLLDLLKAKSLTALVIDAGLVGPGRLHRKNVPLEDLDLYARHYITVDPMCAVYRAADGVPRTLSEYFADGGFGRDAFTGEFLPRLDVRHVIGVVHPLPEGRLLGIGIHRAEHAADFGDRERELLSIVGPSITRACAGTLAREEALHAIAPAPGAERVRSGGAIYAASGELIHAGPVAKRLLEEMAALPSRPDLELARNARELATPPGAEGAGRVLEVELAGRRILRIRLSLVVKKPTPEVLVVFEVLTPGSAELFHAFCDRAGLSPRERDVAALAARGLGNREIARELEVSPATVGTHLLHIHAKTGARSRIELALLLLGGEVDALGDAGKGSRETSSPEGPA